MKDRDIIQYLDSLTNTYELLQGAPLKVFLCGGSALIALNLIERATKDIDLVGPPELTPEFWEAAKVTADYFQLPSGWINQGPVSLWTSGLPKGFEERCLPLKLKSRSTHLQLFLSSRLDQIHFKLYATVDQGPGRHMQDLLQLQPTTEELLLAAQWCLTQDASQNFRLILKDFLQKQGWHDVVAQMA